MDRAYHVAIEKAVQLNVRSVSIPAIGTGSFGLSFEDAANCVVGALVSISNFGALKVRTDLYEASISLEILENPIHRH